MRHPGEINYSAYASLESAVSAEGAASDIYVPVSEAEQAARLDSPAVLIAEWRDVVYPNWVIISQFSSRTRMLDFVQIMALTALRPCEFVNVPIHAIVADKFINVEDAIAGRLACTLLVDESKRQNIVKANWYHNMEEGDLSMYYSRSGRMLDTMFGSLIKSAGPDKVLSSEQTLHALLTIPAGLFVGYSIPELHSHVTDSALSYTPWIYNTFVVFLALNHFMYLLSFILSIMWATAAFFAQSSDRIAAAYFSIPTWFRFLDFILVWAALCISSPIAQVVSSFQSKVHSGTYLVAWLLICFYLVMNIFVGFTGAVMFSQAHNAIEYSDPHKRISSTEDIIYEPKLRGRWSLLLSRLLLHQHGAAFETLRNIGSYRKNEIAATTKSAFMETVTAQIMNKDMASMARAASAPDRPPPAAARPALDVMFP
jgi:hypothetical protein